MTLLIGRTWLPTFALVALTVAVGLWQIGGVLVTYSALTAVVLTPVLWLKFVNRVDRGTVGRGAAAGAFIAAVAQWLPTIASVGWHRLTGAYGNALERDLDMVGVLFVVGVGCLAAVVGSVLGAMLGLRRIRVEPAGLVSP